LAVDDQEERIVLPEVWFSASEIALRGHRLYYEVGEPRSLREADGRYRHDHKGRVALEAFLALPLEAVWEQLEAVRSPVIGEPAPLDPVRDRATFPELIGFVDRFGPFGLGWNRVQRVLNPDADRLVEENWRLKLAAAGFTGDAPSPTAGTPVWRLVSPDLGRPFYPYVEQVTTYPDLPWAERVRLGDPKIYHDDLGRQGMASIGLARSDLLAAVRLADALSRRRTFELRDAIRSFPREPVFDVRGHDADSSLAIDWRSANLGMAPSDGVFRPFAVHEATVDWVRLGQMVLIEHISTKFSATSIGLGLRNDIPTFGWRIGSLIEVMYRQLLDHIREHPDFGLRTCDLCGAPILQVRREQRWHSGCSQTGRQRVSRATRKGRSSSDVVRTGGSKG